ncbi:unnamed protein product [Paramecium pentaurelia]|uniref:Transmembrane protein n=1 Tax=Paramecium pentaurelia TaxID=43138 RepID=A0A8S1TRM4_9CILI|nr:unnamed protein product [Paramecium pentaurelia]
MNLKEVKSQQSPQYQIYWCSYISRIAQMRFKDRQKFTIILQLTGINLHALCLISFFQATMEILRNIKYIKRLLKNSQEYQNQPLKVIRIIHNFNFQDYPYKGEESLEIININYFTNYKLQEYLYQYINPIYKLIFCKSKLSIFELVRFINDFGYGKSKFQEELIQRIRWHKQEDLERILLWIQVEYIVCKIKFLQMFIY